MFVTFWLYPDAQIVQEIIRRSVMDIGVVASLIAFGGLVAGWVALPEKRSR